MHHLIYIKLTLSSFKKEITYLKGIHMFKPIFAAAVLSSAVLFTACATTTSVKQQETLSLLQDRTWILTYIGATEFKANPNIINIPSIRFDSSSARLSGADGCNLMGGGYNINADKISISQIGTTRMMCANTRELEINYKAALKKVAVFQVYGNTLNLFDAQGNPVLQFKSDIQQ